MSCSFSAAKIACLSSTSASPAADASEVQLQPILFGCPSSLLIQREWYRWWPYDERRNPGRLDFLPVVLPKNDKFVNSDARTKAVEREMAVICCTIVS